VSALIALTIVQLGIVKPVVVRQHMLAMVSVMTTTTIVDVTGTTVTVVVALEKINSSTIVLNVSVIKQLRSVPPCALKVRIKEMVTAMTTTITAVVTGMVVTVAVMCKLFIVMTVYVWTLSLNLNIVVVAVVPTTITEMVSAMTITITVVAAGMVAIVVVAQVKQSSLIIAASVNVLTHPHRQPLLIVPNHVDLLPMLEMVSVTTTTITVAVIGTMATAVETQEKRHNLITVRHASVWTQTLWLKDVKVVVVLLSTKGMDFVMIATMYVVVTGMVAIVVEVLAKTTNFNSVPRAHA
jgi:hypothetical protein